MKRLPLILFLLLSLSTLSQAMEWPIPLKDLVCDSDLIIVGTLSSVNEYSMDGTDYGQGIITLDLRQVFDINAPAPYTFRFKIRGFERGNDCEFYFKPSERLARNDSDEQKNAEAKTTPVYKTQLALWPALGIIVALGAFRLYRRRAQK